MALKPKFGTFDARRWIGGGDDEETAPNVVTSVAQTVAVLERPVVVETPPEPPYVPKRYAPVSTDIKAYSEDQLREYAEVAEAVGVAPTDLIVEKFKGFLLANNITVFSLPTVVSFMDEKAKHEAQGEWGWRWLPLREKDRIDARFGRNAQREDNAWGRDGTLIVVGKNVAASDHYASNDGRMLTEVYSRVVPMSALKKVAMIEKAFKHPIAFMVSDYAPAPALKADPFLMAVVPGAKHGAGEGRFVIDVWDEPGFGIEQMLAFDHKETAP